MNNQINIIQVIYFQVLIMDLLILNYHCFQVYLVLNIVEMKIYTIRYRKVQINLYILMDKMV